jgi:hypothetical protein
MIRFWVDNIPGHGALRLVPADAKHVVVQALKVPTVKTDDHGWPLSVKWGDQLLFDQPPGDFVSVEFTKFTGRWLYNDLLQGDKSTRKETLVWNHAEPVGTTTVEETSHTVVYKQSLKHPRLKWLTRTLEIHKGQPRASLKVRLYRISSELPEWFFIGSSLAVDGTVMPQTSNGGVLFTPFDDQLPGTCRDYFTVDGWIGYTSGDTQRVWVSRDAPLVSFGSNPEPLLRRNSPPEAMNSIYAMVFDNTWLTNFLCDQHGIMEFRFDLVLRKSGGSLPNLAETVFSEPVFINHSELQEPELFMKHLHQP